MLNNNFHTTTPKLFVSDTYINIYFNKCFIKFAFNNSEI